MTSWAAPPSRPTPASTAMREFGGRRVPSCSGRHASAAVRARADDRNPGRKRAQTGGHRRLIVLARPGEPSPPARPSGHARALRGRQAAAARRHAIRLLDIGVLPKAPVVVFNHHPVRDAAANHRQHERPTAAEAEEAVPAAERKRPNVAGGTWRHLHGRCRTSRRRHRAALIEDSLSWAPSGRLLRDAVQRGRREQHTRDPAVRAGRLRHCGTPPAPSATPSTARSP